MGVNKLKIAKQKLEGKALQLKGKLEQEAGHPVKGTIDRVKGKFEENIADAKLEAEKEVRK